MNLHKYTHTHTNNMHILCKEKFHYAHDTERLSESKEIVFIYLHPIKLLRFTSSPSALNKYIKDKLMANQQKKAS